MVLPVGANLEGGGGDERPPAALDRETPAVTARAAAVGDEPVALDHDRELGLGNLDRDVRRGCSRVAQPIIAVCGRSRTPRPDHELEVDERLRLGILSREDRERVAALPGRGHPVRDQLG